MTNKIVKIVSAAIVLALGVSLAGCGKKEENKSSVALDGAGEGYEFVAESKSINDLLKVFLTYPKVFPKNKHFLRRPQEKNVVTLHLSD